MFINRFIGLNPLPIFNNYIYLLKDVDLLMTKNIFRGFFVSLNVISQIENLSSNKKYNIIQIGTLPTFIEAFNKMLGSNSKYTFVKISTMKNKQNVQKKIYDDMCKQLCDKMTFKLTQINIENFYINNMSDNLTNFSDKYDIIIFDTYKNLHQITSDSRYLISMLNLKYIMFQLLFAINKLNSNGTLILLMHGVNTLVQQQIITLISGIFNSVKLLNSEIDYSYRFFLICTGFAFENIGESKLTELIISDSLPMQDYMNLCAKDFSESKCMTIRKGSEKIKVISVFKQIGFAVAAINNHVSYEVLKNIKG